MVLEQAVIRLIFYPADIEVRRIAKEIAGKEEQLGNAEELEPKNLQSEAGRRQI